jgi:hypothetical protein
MFISLNFLEVFCLFSRRIENDVVFMIWVCVITYVQFNVKQFLFVVNIILQITHESLWRLKSVDYSVSFEGDCRLQCLYSRLCILVVTS